MSLWRLFRKRSHFCFTIYWTIYRLFISHHWGWFTTSSLMCQTKNGCSRQAISRTVPLLPAERARDWAVHPSGDTECWTFAAFSLNKSLLIRSCESFPIVYMLLSKPAATAAHRVVRKQQQQTTVFWFLNIHFAKKTSLDSCLCFLTTSTLWKSAWVL